MKTSKINSVISLRRQEIRAAESVKKAGERRQNKEEIIISEETAESYKTVSGGGKFGTRIARMGHLSVVAKVFDNKLVGEAKRNFNTFHQQYDETMEDFVRRFILNIDLLSRTTGQVLTVPKKVYNLITKLNRS